MNSIYNTRKRALEGCKREANFAFSFAERAEQRASEGNCNAAWSCADNAKIAATCAMQAHDALWELTKGKLTADEFEAFEAAEQAQGRALAAARAAAGAVAKAQAEYDKAHGIKRK